MNNKQIQQILINYYNENQILDYPKNKNGFPDMRKKFNKDIARQLKINEILKVNKKQNEHNFSEQKEGDYRKEIEELTDNEIDDLKKINTEMCIICGESMKLNFAILSCKHAFCNSCIILHCRENNNCPMCRKEICKKPKKVIKMNEHILNSIYSDSMLNDFNYGQSSSFNDNNLYNFYDYLWYDIFYNTLSLNDDEQITNQSSSHYNKTRVMYDNIVLNLSKVQRKISNQIITYYESQL